MKNFTKGFVGFKTVTESELKSLLNQLQANKSYYFLKWVDRVSAFISELPEHEPIAPEGQLFNSELELRWRKKANQFELLLLSSKPENISDFQLLGNNHWEYRDDNAIIYPETETRLPKVVKSNGVNVSQRYFRNSETATIHFVALTVSQASSL
jgi:hypothetical protein